MGFETAQIRAAKLLRKADEMVLQLVGLPEDVPELGALLDHVFRVGELVQLNACRPRHLRRKSMHLLLQRHLGLSESGVQFDVHALSLLCWLGFERKITLWAGTNVLLTSRSRLSTSADAYGRT